MDSEHASHPPALRQGDTKEFTFDCAGMDHTQLALAVKQPVESGVELRLLVDGAARETLRGQQYTWTSFVFDVPLGKHSYSLRASATADVEVPFAIDNITCVNVTPLRSAIQRADFDSNYIPPEITGDWFVDNAHGVHDDDSNSASSAAAHPPALQHGDTKDMNFDCSDAEHSQLSFALKQPVQKGVKLEFLVDGMVREIMTGQQYTWDTFVFDVPHGKHTYVFRASASANSAVPFVVDTLVCTNKIPSPSPIHRIDFDTNFVPPEISGDWLIDNVHTVDDRNMNEPGAAAIHPPSLRQGEHKQMDFDCGNVEHTQLTFVLKQPVATAAVKLVLLVDGAPRDILTGMEYSWRSFVFDVPRGVHKYSFNASTMADVEVPFVVDTLVCNDAAPTPSPIQRVDFDRNFVPPEIGGDWLVDNAHTIHDDGADELGAAAVHPPALNQSDVKSMTYNCGAEHTQINFELKQPVAGPTVKLEFLIDGTSRDMPAGSEFSWKTFSYNVPLGQHKYEFRASATANVPVPFVVDTLVCARP